MIIDLFFILAIAWLIYKSEKQNEEILMLYHLLNEKENDDRTDNRIAAVTHSD